MCKPRVTKKHEITVVSVEMAELNSFSKSWNKIKIIRLHVVRRWVIDIEDRINSHGDPRTYIRVIRSAKLTSENSSDVFMQNSSPPLLPLEGGGSLLSMV